MLDLNRERSKGQDHVRVTFVENKTRIVFLVAYNVGQVAVDYLVDNLKNSLYLEKEETVPVYELLSVVAAQYNMTAEHYCEVRIFPSPILDSVVLVSISSEHFPFVEFLVTFSCTMQNPAQALSFLLFSRVFLCCSPNTVDIQCR